jgi:hypothetical protein
MPPVKTPHMSTTRLISAGISGSNANSAARLVIAPTARTVTSCGTGADRVAQKQYRLRRRPEVGPVVGAFQNGVLRHFRLSATVQERPRQSGVDRNVRSPGGAADGVGERGPLRRVASNSRNADQFTARFVQKVGERNGVVDVVADVGV